MKPLKSANIADAVQEWYADFISKGPDGTTMNHDDLLEIILAANYLDIKPLLYLGCAYVASLVKDKTHEEIKTIFGVTNEMTPEHEAALRADPNNKWVEEE